MHALRGSAAASLVVLLGLAACYDRSGLAIGPDAEDPLASLVPVSTHDVRDVDLLIVMDNAGSMAQEQTAFASTFPLVLEGLFSPPDGADWGPIQSLNVGVVSTDVGTLGNRVSGCFGGTWGVDAGDDGCLRHTPSPTVTGCAPSYPSFLSRDWIDFDDYPMEQLTRDLACIATLGTNGCGWTQPMEAARRALVEHTGSGDCNEGFLRSNSLVLVLWISDDDDMSVDPAHPEMLDAERTDLGHLGDARILLHPEMLRSIDVFEAAFRSLETESDPRVLLGMIVGVPPDEPLCTGRGDDVWGCLDQPAMQQQIDPTNPTSFTPSCRTEMGAASPPRRFVELAQAWGERSYVASSCPPDWNAAMDGILSLVGERLGGWACWPELDFGAASCAVAGCFVIAGLQDDRACPDDDACPAAGCPPVTREDLGAGTFSPCVHSATGAECVPLLRDLGLVPGLGSDGALERRCLVRQSPRSFDPATSRCGPPDLAGWYFVLPEWSAHGCAEVLLQPVPPAWLPYGASLELACRRR